MLWMHYFNHSGRVLAVDANKYYAIDVALRMEAYPYSMLTGMERQVVLAGLGNTRGW